MSIWAAWVLQGRARSILIVSATGLLSLIILPVALISGAVVTLIALRNRLEEIAAVLFAASALCTVFLWAVLGRAELALQLPVFWILAAAGGVVLRRSSNMALALLVPVCAGLLIVGLIYMMYAEPVELWKEVLVQSGQVLGLDPDAAGFSDIVTQRARLMTGMVAAAVMAGMSSCLLLGRWWQASLYNPGEFGREFRSLRCGRGITLLIVGLYALCLWNGSELLLSVLCVLAALYGFQGLALVHTFAKARTMNFMAITIFYVVVLLSIYAKLFLSVLGMVDAWVDSRRRWLGGASSV
ncbi:MAG TPA: DUF2232 domain-containing protein [Gammaproteobacteria bacterium]